jgi:hypothetical protein
MFKLAQCPQRLGFVVYFVLQPDGQRCMGSRLNRWQREGFLGHLIRSVVEGKPGTGNGLVVGRPAWAQR